MAAALDVGQHLTQVAGAALSADLDGPSLDSRPMLGSQRRAGPALQRVAERGYGVCAHDRAAVVFDEVGRAARR